MLVVKPALSTKSLACIEKLRSLSLLPIVARLMDSQEGCGWTLPQAIRAIERYKTFLFVSYLYPEILLVPTREIDRVWHVHILHTRKYRQDCEMLFGHFIDHEPDFELWGESHQKNFDEAFAQTQRLLALFEGYFTQADLEDQELHQTDRNPSAENQSQLGSKRGKKDLFLCRSAACGRLKTYALWV